MAGLRERVARLYPGARGPPPPFASAIRLSSRAIEVGGRDVRATLESGSAFDLGRPPAIYPPLDGR